MDAIVRYRISGAPAGVHIGMPSTSLTLIVAFGEPLRLSGAPVTPTPTPRTFDVAIAGLHAGPAHIHHEGHQHGVQVSLTPTGAGLLLGGPAGELAGRCIELGDLIGPSAGRLREQTEASRDLGGALRDGHRRALRPPGTAPRRRAGGRARLAAPARERRPRGDRPDRRGRWLVTTAPRSDVPPGVRAPTEDGRSARAFPAITTAHRVRPDAPGPGGPHLRIHRPEPPQPRLAGPGGDLTDAVAQRGRDRLRPRRAGPPGAD